MRRILIVTALVSLLATVLPTQANAAAKVGARCTKVGATTKVGKTTLKCATNKKWVLAKPSTPVVPPAALTRVALKEGCHEQSNATLQREENGAWKDVATALGWELTNSCLPPAIYRPWTNANVKVGDQLRWKVSTSGKEWVSHIFSLPVPIAPYPVATAADAAITDFATVGSRSRDSVLSIPVSAKPNTVTFKSESTINQGFVDFAKGTGDFAMKYLASLLPKDMIYNVMIFNSRNWGLTTALTYDPQNAVFVDDMQRTFTRWGDRPLSNCRGGGGFSVGYLDDPLLAIDHGCSLEDRDYSLIAHEFTHSVQAKYGQTTNPQCLAPIWFVEGQAQTFGVALANYNGSKWMEARKAAVSQQETPYANIMKEMEPASLRGQEYSTGLLMVEYLVARSGWKKSLDLLLEANRIGYGACLSPTSRMPVFSQAFKNVYGQTLDQFYAEVYPYLQWSYANKSN